MSDNPLSSDSYVSGNTQPYGDPFSEWDDTYPVDDGYAKVRRHPKGIKLYKQTDEEVEFTARMPIYRLWILPYSLGPLWIVLGTSLSIYMSYIEKKGQYGYGSYMEFSTPLFLFLFVVFVLAPCIVLFVFTHPVVKVNATKEHLIIGDYRFDRRYFTSMRIGFSVEGSVSAGQSGKPQQFFFSKIWVGYGQWGESIKYMLPANNAEAILTWAKQLIDSVGQVERAPTIEQGYREQKF